MNNKSVRELRAKAKDSWLKGYYKLKKAELIDLLDTPQRPPRRAGQKKPIRQVTILPNSEDMDNFELREVLKNRSVVKEKLNEWYDWLVSYVPKPIKELVSNAFSKVKRSIMALYKGVKGVKKTTLKEEVEEQAQEEHNEKEAEDLTPVEHKQAMNGAYKSFRVGGQNKADVDSYIELVKPKISKLIKVQLKILQSAKVQMHLWIMWKKNGKDSCRFR